MEGEQNTQGAPQVPQTPPSTPQGDNTLLMGILAYLFILVLIPLLVAKDNAFVQFHVRQGLVLTIIEVIVMLAVSMVPLLFPIAQIVNLGLLVLAILGIVNVVQKKEVELPLVGQYAKHINL